MTATDMTLAAFCERHKITADVSYGAPPGEQGQDSEWRRTANPWTVTLKFGRRRLTTGYWTGAAITDEPTAADVLGCLMLDASSVDDGAPYPRLFRDWCDDFGYDTDSRKALAAYEACCKLAPKLRRFLGALYDDAQSAEH